MHRDEREIRGASADIGYQDEIAYRYVGSPARVAFDPGIERRLRLFEQRDYAVAGLFRRL